MANLTSGLIETAPGGLPLIRDFGYNSNKNIKLGGSATIDTTNSSGTSAFGAISVTSLTNTGSSVGSKSNIISGSGATVTLTAAQSGSIALFDRAAGIVYTLPAPAVGLRFTFIVTTTITSNNAKVITDAGTTLIQGFARILSSGTPNDFAGNGTSHISVIQNGTTTGGVLGSWLQLECVSSTLWQATGLLNGSGTTATPFSNT